MNTLEQIMSKTLRIGLIVVGVFLVTFLVLGQTGMFKMCDIPTATNEPGIKLNSKIFFSNLVDFNNGDFVCCRYKNDPD